MIAVLVGMLLSAQPNLFEPKEPSSEDIFAGVALCMDKTMTATGGGETSAIVTCGCLMDAQRANVRRGAKRPDPTPEQMTRCHVLARDRTTPPKPGKSGT